MACGPVGIDPRPFTLRELLAMREAKEREEWDRTSQILSALATYGYRYAKDASPDKFHKFNTKREVKLTAEAIRSMRPPGMKGPPP